MKISLANHNVKYQPHFLQELAGAYVHGGGRIAFNAGYDLFKQ